MNALSFLAGRRVHTSLHHQDHDHCHSCDSEPPNHHAHRRWFILLLIVFALAAAAAVLCGVVKGFADMAAAFNGLPSLLDVAAWDRFFAGFGRIAAIVLVGFLTVIVLRRRKRLSPKK